MMEPIPARISPPQGKEPTIRVGLVLSGDARRSCTISPSTNRYRISWDGQSRDLAPGEVGTISNSGGNLSLQLVGKAQSASSKITVTPVSSSALTPGAGLKLNQVVAGRGFHWQKNVDLVFPGSLEILVSAGHIVVVNEVGFEDYCACVLASEMSAACPPEFLKAQATAARSWAFVFLRNKHPGESFQICNDDDCQRYQGSTFLTPQALSHLALARGYFVTGPDGAVTPAYYSKCCGGFVEAPEASFGFEVPGLGARIDAESASDLNLEGEADAQRWCQNDAAPQCYCSPESVPPKDLRQYLGAVDENAAYYRWKHALTREVVSGLIRERCACTDLHLVQDLKAKKRGKSARILELEVSYRDTSGSLKSLTIGNQYDIRKALHQSFLFSSAFTASWKKAERAKDDVLELSGAGWGHGVGLCQIGGVGMALQGKSFVQVLKHYFPGCEVSRVY